MGVNICLDEICIIISYIKGGTQTKDISKQDPEANIWAQEGCE
jgi:hypothetical protein